MRIAIVTDAWAPQVNGVVRTLEATVAELERRGDAVLVISPAGARTLPCPTYPEIRLALTTPRSVGRRIAAFGAEAIHIATEGPLGIAARRWCVLHRHSFTTAFHTQFPDYVAARTGVDPAWVWRYVRWFHAPAAAVLASTPSIEATLRAHGLMQVRRWGRGVAPVFRAGGARLDKLAHLPRPLLLHVGRLAVEKNIAAFLSLDVPGTRLVVGDGPARAALAAQHPDAIFLGALFGEELAAAYRSADVLVFPSRTDTFGLVMIEALACGTPVAAYPVPGPVDVLTPGTGAMDEDLASAVGRALKLDRGDCTAAGARFTWAAAADQFRAALAPLHHFVRAA